MRAHFLGIGGIGMSALAHILLEKGEAVSGFDCQGSALIDQLCKKGAQIHIGGDFTLDPEVPVVYSSAIRKDHPTLVKAKQKYHRSQFLGKLMKGQKSLLVTGTHGKTSTSGLLAWTLIHAGMDPTYALGGILKNTNQNGGYGKGTYFVAEADESDGSFLNYPGYGAIITNLEREHLDYWKTEENLKKGFQKFARGIENPKLLFWCGDDPSLRSLDLPGKSYGWAEDADYRLLDVEHDEMKLTFTVANRGVVQLPLIGKHQALNALAVWALAHEIGIPEKKVREAFRAFKGIKRRLEKKGERSHTIFYDDYAHHPTEINALLTALKEGAKKKRIVAIFQPHRYSRTHDLMDQFAGAFEKADQIITTDVYAAGEIPISGVSGKHLAEKIKGSIYIPRNQLRYSIQKLIQNSDIIITIGAGDITHLHEEWA